MLLLIIHNPLYTLWAKVQRLRMLGLLSPVREVLAVFLA
jgi:hypothetical protein